MDRCPLVRLSAWHFASHVQICGFIYALQYSRNAHCPVHVHPNHHAFLLVQIFRQELEVRRAAIQHQQQQYGEGQDMPGSGGAPAAKRQKVVEAEPEPVGRQRDSDDEDD
jgi:hypothetical protein